MKTFTPLIVGGLVVALCVVAIFIIKGRLTILQFSCPKFL
jgi:hypothetical protein